MDAVSFEIQSPNLLKPVHAYIDGRGDEKAWWFRGVCGKKTKVLCVTTARLC